ncbi:sodium/proline symporter PutP [Planctobacterium marinum]|uniref:sodium/proline symporter PutP n=1 Tax=Planctobacterium marinum TaxID=1631968 RepID=UPI001E29AEE9|nr:sodium/proline symporter PutP [Planctobacterium marinum]MCC2604531.1 sodium/proline symporter PutP [Planctobacterium marinum]
MDPYLLLALALYFCAMLAIGLFAFKTNDASVSGFLLGGRKVGPAVTALSAGASDMSGWMLMGLPGAMYLSGLSSSWIAIGLLIGAWCNYTFVAPRLRTYTEVTNSLTIPDFLERRFEDNSRILRIVSAMVIITFFAIYTTSGVVGGGKLFESAFELPYELGLYITAGIVVIYTLFGGYLAVSMTDFVQGCIMFVALIMVPVVAIFELGGSTETSQLIQTANSEAFNLINGVSLLAILSSMAWGLGYFGQPHIIVRFMAISSVKDLKVARKIGMSWMLVTLIGALAVGLTGLAYVHKTQLPLSDPETIFIVLSNTLFHPFISGFLLAAILAAIMSTVSSQLLVTSSSLATDLYHEFINKDAPQKQVLLVSRISIFLVAALAIFIAHDRDSSILSLVSNAWAGFGAAFGPLVLFSLFWKKTTRAGAITGMLTGAITVLFWIYAPVGPEGATMSAYLYEIVPGFIVATLSIWLVSLCSQDSSESMQQDFMSMQKNL